MEHSFLHALTGRAQLRGFRTLLYTAGSDDVEIRAYESLLSEYDLDGFVLTGTHTGDERTAWLRGPGHSVRDVRPSVGPRGGPSAPGTPGWTSTEPAACSRRAVT